MVKNDDFGEETYTGENILPIRSPIEANIDLIIAQIKRVSERITFITREQESVQDEAKLIRESMSKMRYDLQNMISLLNELKEQFTEVKK